MFKRLLTFSILFVALCVGKIAAQGVTTGSITGIVTDSKGEALPGATVVAIHTPSGTQYGVVTRQDGRYTFPAARIGGPYTVKVTFVSYREQTRENLFVQLGQSLITDFKLLEESEQLQEVVISAARNQVLNEDRTGASTNVGTTQLQRLPSIARSVTDFSRLDPRGGSGGNNFAFAGRSSLYNNFSVDGATVNNVFGLSALPGGQSGASPISIDAIQELSVQVAPYDVRQGNFTGAGVNAVTRSGTNDFSGSVYYFWRNQNYVGKKVDGNTSPLQAFDFQNYGFRLGGPIIKNKLFFFVNAEIERRNDPAYTFPVRENRNTPLQGSSQPTADNDPELGLEGLRSFLIGENNGKSWSFDPGVYNNLTLPSNNNKFVARLDYNINQNHKLTVRGNALSAYRDVVPSNSSVLGLTTGRSPSNNSVPFSSSFYRINNKQYSVTAELNSTLGNGKYTNNLVFGWNIFRDTRQGAGGASVPNFPVVDILGPNGQVMTSFGGSDPFTPNNLLNQDVIQFNDNLSIYLKNHTVTIGTANEYYRFNNTFTPGINGVYVYNSIADFIADASSATTANARPAAYAVQPSAVKGDPAPAAKWNALQLGFFAQDEYTGIKNLKLTGGLRVDIPLYLTDLPANNYINSLDLNGEKLRIGAWPTVRPLWSPRIGFNWDVKGDRTTQVRGGTGVFTGRVPFVWLSNTVSNNGLLFGSTLVASGTADFSRGTNPIPVDFDPNPYRPDPNTLNDLSTGQPTLVTNPLDRNYGRLASQTTVNTVTKNFRFPQVWRTNLAIDQQLPGGLVGTLEFIYTKDINAVYIRNANLAAPVGTLPGDGRPLYGADPGATNRTIVSNDRRVSGDLGQALVLDNTNKGYQYSFTAQLQKTFNRNFSVSAAYTYTDARDLNSQSGSTAGTIYNSQITASSLNSPEFGYSANLTPHRVLVYGTYRVEYLKHLATALSFTYIGSTGNNFSYVYAGDPNSDGVSNTDLIYIPRSREEIALTTSGATDTRTLDQIWQQLDGYISQDKYLSSRRGQYAQRNATFQPWVNSLNISLLQDVYIDVKGKRNTLQFSVNLENALNFLNSSWGLVRIPNITQPLRFVGFESPHTAGTVGTNGQVAVTTPTTGRPVYAFDLNSDGSVRDRTFIPSQGVGSRWQIQLGLRYIFN